MTAPRSPIASVGSPRPSTPFTKPATKNVAVTARRKKKESPSRMPSPSPETRADFARPGQAGARLGLTRKGTRPQFGLVRGVSTGALIAPFAFLGPAWDQRPTEAAMTAGNGSLLQWRGGILYDPAVYSGEPLAQFVDRFVTG